MNYLLNLRVLWYIKNKNKENKKIIFKVLLYSIFFFLKYNIIINL